MASTHFVDNDSSLANRIVAAWLNDINLIAYDILGNGTAVPTTKAQALVNLGVGEFIQSTLVPTYASASSFTVAGNQTGVFTVGRRVAFTVTAGVVYGTVASAVFGALTTVTMTMDSGDVLDSGLTTTYPGIIGGPVASLPQTLVAGSGVSISYTDGLPTIAATGASMPTGTILDFGGTAAPSGYLMCDGSAVDRTTYAGLFAVIGETWGPGDGVSTFNVPDLRGRATFGQDDMGGPANRLTTAGSGVDGATIGAVGGSQLLAGHTHTGTTASDGAHTHTLPAAGAGASIPIVDVNTDLSGTTITSSSDGAHTHTFTSDSTGAGSSANVPPAAVVLKIIKT